MSEMGGAPVTLSPAGFAFTYDPQRDEYTATHEDMPACVKRFSMDHQLPDDPFTLLAAAELYRRETRSAA